MGRMRLPSLRHVSVGFFAGLSILSIVLWAISTCALACYSWHPAATSEFAGGFVRGRLVLVNREEFVGKPGFDAEWWGMPRSKSDLSGEFYLNSHDGPLEGYPHAAWSSIEIPLPFLASAWALIAFVIHRQFRLTLAACLVTLVAASILLAVYAHPQKDEYRPMHPDLVDLMEMKF
jgi:hypothetical protein